MTHGYRLIGAWPGNYGARLYIQLSLFAFLIACCQIAAQDQVPIHDIDGSAIREWLVLGPFPSRNIENDFLERVGGEAAIRPKEGDTVDTSDGKQLVWTRLRSNHDVIDLDQVFGRNEWSIAYAYCELRSDDSHETDARAVSSDTAVLWVNGQKVERQPTWPSVRTDMAPTVPLRLEPGRNPCLLKLKVESRPYWAFSFQPLPRRERATIELTILDQEGHPVDGASIQVYDQGDQVGRLRTYASGEAEACLYPLADSYDLRITYEEQGTWLSGATLRPEERRKLTVKLTDSVSISGKVLALDDSPQNAIVVQALRISDHEVGSSSEWENRALRRDITAGPRINSGNYDGQGIPEERDGTAVQKIQSLFPMPSFSETALTDSNGNFRFVNLRAGRYRLRAHGARRFFYPESDQESDLPQIFLVEPGHNLSGVQFVFPDAKKGVWNRFPIRNGLNDLECTKILRTSDGMLWVGTLERTLHAYDGVEFKIFTASDRSANNFNDIKADSTGRIWIGTDTGISSLVNGQIQTTSFADFLPSRLVSSIETDSSGTVWFATGSGLCRYDGKKLVGPPEEGLAIGQVGALLRARDGRLWMSTGHSIASLDGRDFAEPVLLSGLRRPVDEGLHEARDGAIWFCSREYESAAYRYDGNSLLRLGREEGLLNDTVYSIAETSDGALWFGTPLGISRFNGSTIVNYTSTDGLGDTDVRDIFVDSDDVLWLACNAGVSRFDPKGFVGITKRDGLENRMGRSPVVFDMEPTGKDGYLIGTEWGGLYQLNDQDDLSSSSTGLFAEAYVRHIQRTPEGEMYYGTADGLYRQDAGRMVRVLERAWILAMNSDRQGRLWLGHGWTGGGASRYDPETGDEIVLTRAQGLPDDSVYAIELGRDGDVWIGTGAGLARFRDGRVENIGEILKFPLGWVMNLRIDQEGTLWIGSDTGLHRLNGTDIVSIAALDDAPVDGVWSSARTDDGITWIGTANSGLVGVDGQAVTMIDKRDGLLGNSVFNLLKDDDESLLIGFIDGGLTRYRRTETRPSVRLVNVNIEDQIFSDFSDLPSTEIGKRVSFEYQEIDLKTHPEKRQFLYRMEGPSGEALSAGMSKDRRFEWTPRKRGNYTFEVQAVDRDLNYSTPARITFRATVPWYSNLWIIVPIGGFFGALLIWAIVAQAIYLRQRRESERLREQMLLQEREAREALEDKTRQLEKAKEEADGANQAKSSFLANMSHEIRTPLNAVLGCAQILRRTPDLPDDKRSIVRTIENSGDHLLSLINSVLDLSKIEAGGMELSLDDFDLRELILGIVTLFEAKCQTKGIRLIVECNGHSKSEGTSLELESIAERRNSREDAKNIHSSRISPPEILSVSDISLDPVPVRGDEGKLRQVLINLLGNAVKFTNTGRVTLRVEVSRGGKHPMASDLATYTFEIVDTGVGISSDAQAELFAPFVQVGEGVKKGGTGLGLAISKRLVELMGGNIGVRSVLEEGSTFYFSVPLAPAIGKVGAPVRLELREPSQLAEGFSVNSLIVDDIEQNREVLCRILASLGCQVRSSENGEDALDQIRSEIPDIVFTDLRMPVMDGFELQKRILEEFGSNRIRIVAISASVLAHEQRHYQRCGFDDFIGKPFKVARIGHCLSTLLSVNFDYLSTAEDELESPLDQSESYQNVVLPLELLTRLKRSAKAYRVIDVSRCLEEIRKLGGEERRLAASLESLNEKSEMNTILQILEKLDPQ